MNLLFTFDDSAKNIFRATACTLSWLFLALWFLVPTSLYSSDNNLKKAQEKSVEGITEIDNKRNKLKEESIKCSDRVVEWRRQLEGAKTLYEALQTAKKEKAKWQFVLDNEKRTPGLSDKQVREIQKNLLASELQVDYRRREVSLYAAMGLYNEGQWEALYRLQDHCWELKYQWEDAGRELEQLQRRAENLKDFECDNLLGEFKAAANSDKPSITVITGVLERGKDCPWYKKQIEALLEFTHRNDTEGDKDQGKQEEPPPPPPVDDEEVAEDGPNANNQNAYFEEVGEDDSDPAPPPKPPVEEDVAEDGPNEYFEEVGESEVGSTADNSYDQSGNLCSTLLSQFNATYNIEQMWAILQQAQNCSWFGAGVAALQNQINYYKEQNPSQQQNQQRQAVRPGALTILPNPFPNPYAKPPTPEPWRLNQRPGAADLTHFDWQKAADRSRTNPPPKNQQRPTAPPKSKPPKPASKPPKPKPPKEREWKPECDPKCPFNPANRICECPVGYLPD